MASSKLNSSTLQEQTSQVTTRHAILVLLALLVLTCGNGIAQVKGVVERDTSSHSYQDSTFILLEDLLGRFPDGVAALSDFSHLKTSPESPSKFTSGSDWEYNHTSLSILWGNRRSYQMKGTFDNLSPRYSNQNYELGVYLRPLNTLQLSEVVSLYHYGGTLPVNTFVTQSSITYLSNGGIQFSENKFQYYYYLSELVPDQGTFYISVVPYYSHLKGGSDDQPRVSNYVWIPVSVSYALTARTALEAAASYSTGKDKSQYPITLDNQQLGVDSSGFEYETGTLGLNLKHAFSDNALLVASADWHDENSTSWHFLRYSNGYQQYERSEDKTNYTLAAISLDYLSVDRAVSVIDLRQSFYNGRFLNEGDTKNLLKLSYSSPNAPSHESLRLDDDFGLGVTNHLELDAGGRLAGVREPYNYSTDVAWGYVLGLSLHNLNFSESELNDFDYMYGRITQPGDYLVSVKWEQKMESSLAYSERSTLRADIQSSLLESIDFRLGYTYSVSEDAYSGGPNHALDISVRTDLLKLIRLQLIGTWGRNKSDLAGTSRTLGIELALNALF